jgi:hypothetical protein
MPYSIRMRLERPQVLADHFEYMANMALKVHSILANNSRQTTSMLEAVAYLAKQLDEEREYWYLYAPNSCGEKGQVASEKQIESDLDCIDGVIAAIPGAPRMNSDVHTLATTSEELSVSEIDTKTAGNPRESLNKQNASPSGIRAPWPGSYGSPCHLLRCKLP